MLQIIKSVCVTMSVIALWQIYGKTSSSAAFAMSIMALCLGGLGVLFFLWEIVKLFAGKPDSSFNKLKQD